MKRLKLKVIKKLTIFRVLILLDWAGDFNFEAVIDIEYRVISEDLFCACPARFHSHKSSK